MTLTRPLLLLRPRGAVDNGRPDALPGAGGLRASSHAFNPAIAAPFCQRRETVGTHRAGGFAPPASLKDET